MRDGSKRLGWLATAVSLDLNGVDLVRASNDDVYDLVVNVAAGEMSVEEIANRLWAVLSGRFG
jgi:death-on-curing protein